MAHSSGGGSSGGGCHGGSGGSHSGGSGNHPHRHCSCHRFPGSKRYSYLDQDGNRRYVYADHDPSKRQHLPWLTYFALLFMTLTFARDPEYRFFVPHRIVNPSSQIIIEDTQNVIADEEGLRQKLAAFYTETGVTPAVKTVSREQWAREHRTLMRYALDQYYLMFPDEKHWLIVYSRETDSTGVLQPDQWQFEGIIGDNTGASINDWMCEKFTEQTYENLIRMEDPGQAIGKSFASLQRQRGHILSYNCKAILPLILPILFFGPSAVLQTVSVIRSYRYKDAVLDEWSGF